MEGPPAMSATDVTRATPDLRYGESEEDLRKVVRGLFTDRSPLPAVLAHVDRAILPHDSVLWHSLAAELGCAGLLIPESQGGAGASYREAAVVAEETGRAVAPVPFLGSAVVATTALLGTGDKLLSELASGRVSAALAVEFTRMPPGAGVPGSAWGVHVAKSEPGDLDDVTRLTGTVSGVADALGADVLLVPADGVPFGLYAVEGTAAGLRRDPVVSLDATRPLADITLDGVLGRRVATGEAATSAVAAALRAGAGMLASEQLGVGQRCLEMTLAYVKERKQFARPIGSFQALKHRIADVWVSLVQAQAAARYAAACLATDDPDIPVAVAMAKAACGEAAVHAAQECVQLHGGVGFTWEHPAHLLLKRAKSGSLAFGTPDRHRASLAHLVDLPPPLQA
ncbi:MAG TPA: acyl-CoA dehydrogenase family protein [Streptosporangiaceae bacterium]|nr:acyl-CoA dehydrogenase family protein [Streptosporangiaceae bacterium]